MSTADRAALGLVALLDGIVSPTKPEALGAILRCRVRVAVGTLVNAHLLAETDGDAVVAAFLWRGWGEGGGLMDPLFSGPWLPWFHADFMNSTQGWTLIERGVYFLLLCASWQMGPLQTDKRRLAGIVGAQLDEFEEAWKVVQHKFDATEAGLVNRRLEVHRAKQAKRSKKARQSANMRWQGGSDANASANAHANGNASQC